MPRLEHRLHQLERELPDSGDLEEQSEQERQDTEREHRLWLELFATMSEEHVELVVSEATARAEALQAGREPVKVSALTQEAFSQVTRHFYQRQYHQLAPLSLPPAIATAYLEHEHTIPLHDCERCGMQIPIIAGQLQPYRPVRRLFDACPACGGRVGYYAHYYSMRGAIGRCSQCHEMRPANSEQSAHLARHARKRCTCPGWP